nr:hypothetical protein [Tanacetum cinerariifolium]
MADSWKAMDLNMFVVKDDMIDYVLHMYGSNWQIHAAIADDMLDDLLKREWKKQKCVKYVVIIESDTSYDYFPRQTTSDESSDHNPFQATFDESYDHNPFQVTSDDTLKSSSEDTRSSDCTWEQKKLLKNRGLDLPKQKKPFEVQTKRPPPVTNPVLGLATVTTWKQILNKEFGMKSSKENVGGSSNVRMQGKRKML